MFELNESCFFRYLFVKRINSYLVINIFVVFVERNKPKFRDYRKFVFEQRKQGLI